MTNWLPVLNVGDGGRSEVLHPAKSMMQHIAPASTNPLIIGRLVTPFRSVRALTPVWHAVNTVRRYSPIEIEQKCRRAQMAS